MTRLFATTLVACVAGLVGGCGSSKTENANGRSPETGAVKTETVNAADPSGGDFSFPTKPSSVDGDKYHAKLSIAIDGSVSDWADSEVIWQEAGKAGPGKFPGKIDIQQVYIKNDAEFLYAFMRTLPTVQDRFDKKSSSGNLCNLFIDADNDPSTGAANASELIDTKSKGYEFDLWIPLGVQASSVGTSPFVSYDLRTVGSDGKFGFDSAAESSSSRDKSLIAHGVDGVELAIPLSKLDAKSGSEIRLVLKESTDPFDKERFSEATFTVK